MRKGVIKWYNSQKGYGFIASDEGGSDVFLHATSLERAGIQYIADGQKVSFELATNKGRTSAVNISIIEDEGSNSAQ